jgi:lipopolysaccharide export system protein LptA
MTGDPVLIQKENRISGEKIVINVRKDTSEVFSGEKKRVEALFYSRPDEGEKE